MGKLAVTRKDFEEALNKSTSVNNLCEILNKTKPSVYTYASRFNLPLKGKFTTKDYIRVDGYYYYNNPKNHRRIYENHIGKELESNVSVHHIDGDKTNNDVSNLIALTKSEHQLAHKSLESVGFELLKEDLIEFDVHSKTYRLNKVKGKAKGK